jgi:hypothetical protein
MDGSDCTKEVNEVLQPLTSSCSRTKTKGHDKSCRLRGSYLLLDDVTTTVPWYRCYHPPYF